MGQNVEIKILIWYIVCEMVKKWLGQGFIFHAIIPACYTY